MIHLTLTGPDAGRPLCDCNKALRIAIGDRFAHAVYAPLENPAFLADTCGNCLRVWAECGESDTPMDRAVRNELNARADAAQTATPLAGKAVR